MRHPRVRRPFIVESRGTSRDSHSVAIPKRVPSAPQHLSPALAESARPLFDPWAEVTRPSEAPVSRRILPNLMEPAEPIAAEPEIALPENEPPLPRVRRVKPRAAAPKPRPKPVEAPVAPPPRPVLALEPRAVSAPAQPVRLTARAERTDRAALPAGQRWKARLPRSCW